MKTLDRILKIAANDIPRTGLDCLLIGGFAVNYYGYTRNTLDVDFMIAADSLATVRCVMIDAGFTNITASENVIFFTAPDSPMRADFLLVDSETMPKLLANAISATVYGHILKLPALKDLIAMKLFAVAHAKMPRAIKDIPDIAYLTILNNLNLEKDILPLCKQFACDSVFKEVSKLVEALTSKNGTANGR